MKKPSKKTHHPKREGKRRRITIQDRMGLPGDIEVKIPRASIHLQTTKGDLARATKADPNNCVFACAAKRMFPNTPWAIFYRRVAYVGQLDGKGVPFIGKFVLLAAAAEAVKQFDVTGKMPEHGITLSPMTWGRTPQRVKEREALNKHRREAKGTGKRRIRRPDAIHFRPSGTGLYHMGLQPTV